MPPVDMLRIKHLLAQCKDIAADPVDRILAELDFAADFNELAGPASGRWSTLINKAWALLAEASGGTSGRPTAVNKLAKAVREAEDLLSPIGKAAKKYTIHCVGHAHIDMNWLWSWPETVHTTNDTFLSVLNLMDEFEEFCFCQSQASVYEIIRQHNPEMFERIRQRVAEGRWEVAAVHWVEGDKNLVSGESLARHLLYTRRYMSEQFGLSPEDCVLDWSPDTFGHALTIPTINTRGGVRRYYMCRGGAAEKPPVFFWQAPDGSRLLVNIEQNWYNSRVVPEIANAMVTTCRKTGLRDFLYVYGVGDHGGGPTRHDLRMIRELQTWPIFPTLKMTTTASYYKALEANADAIPTREEELNFEFTGCYTSQSAIKKTNRLGEHQAMRAEAAAVLAMRIAGRSYPTAKLRQAWIDTIFGHFHDILPGSGIPATRDYHLGRFQETAAATSMIESNALRDIAGRVDLSFAVREPLPRTARTEPFSSGAGMGQDMGMGGPATFGPDTDLDRGFVVFNPNAWPRKEVIEVLVWDGEVGSAREHTYEALLPDGTTLPTQRIGQGSEFFHHHVRLAVPVDLPALGYASLAVRDAGMIPWKHPDYGCQDKSAWAVENDHIAIEIDPTTGGLTRLVDKSTGRGLIAPDRPALLEYAVERPDHMSAWLIHPFLRRIPLTEARSVKVGHAGPYVQSFVATYLVEESDVTVTYTLKADQPGLEITVDAHWRQHGSARTGTPSLRLLLPLCLEEGVIRRETPFGSIEAPVKPGQEVPTGRWIDVTGKLAADGAFTGLAVLNDCKAGYALKGDTLSATLIRSSYEPDPLPEFGKQSMRFCLIPHGKPTSPAALTRRGADFNLPPAPITTAIRPGKLPARSPDVMIVAQDNIVLAAVKKSEADDALIVRLYETAGKDTTARVTISPAVLGEVRQALEVDLLERPTEPSSAKATAEGFSVKVPAFGIAAVRVELSS